MHKWLCAKPSKQWRFSQMKLDVFLTYYDPMNTTFDNENVQLLGWPNRYIGYDARSSKLSSHISGRLSYHVVGTGWCAVMYDILVSEWLCCVVNHLQYRRTSNYRIASGENTSFYRSSRRAILGWKSGWASVDTTYHLWYFSICWDLPIVRWNFKLWRFNISEIK